MSAESQRDDAKAEARSCAGPDSRRLDEKPSRSACANSSFRESYQLGALLTCCHLPAVCPCARWGELPDFRDEPLDLIDLRRELKLPPCMV